MSKNKKNRGGAPKLTAAEKQQAQRLAKEEAERAERNRKSRAMGMAFLYAFLALIALFCLYTLIRTLFFRAASVAELRSNYLFLSLVTIPYLIGTAAVLVRWLRKKHREEASDRVRRSENLVYLVVLLCAALMFGWQMLSGQRDVSGHPVRTAVISALEKSGAPVTPTDETLGFRSVLEDISMQDTVICGKSLVVLNYHRAGLGIPARFLDQAQADYAGTEPTVTELHGASVTCWPASASGTTFRGAVCAVKGRDVLVLEVLGPEQELQALLPLLTDGAAEALAG